MVASTDLKKQVLSILIRERKDGLTLKQLAHRLKLRDEALYRRLRALVQDLQKSGVLETDSRAHLRYVRPGKKDRAGRPAAREGPQAGTGKITGVLSVTRRGGFVRSAETGEEVFIPTRFHRTALHGDVVTAVPFARSVRRDNNRTPEGEVVEVVRRARTTLTGTLEQGRHFTVVEPDDERILRDIYIADDDRAGARHGEKVVVELFPWDNEHLNPEGRVIEVLGPAGDPRVEVVSVARSFGLPPRFPEEVEHEAAGIPGAIEREEVRRRLDLRKAPCFTIDPEDAKDFDDAVSFEEGRGGLMRLGVHIADVSHYVRDGSALDREAYLRGTSVYLVNEVVPMLPERLSNDLCSLRPREDRLTFSVLMDVNATGVVEGYKIQKAVINSARRFTYEEAQAIIERGRGEYGESLLGLHRLSRILSERRRRAGSIDFDTGEVKFRFDQQGLPSAIVKKQRLDAHRLIEECMLLANRTVAEHVTRMKEYPFLYRVHDRPDERKLSELATFVKQFGFSLNVSGGVPARELQKLLDRVRGSEVENLINEIALRTMAKAVYAEKNIGHYGLAFRHYTHFTSPIRRYPDLIVHRLLEEYAGRVPVRRLNVLREHLPMVARQSSDRERVAVEAERASVKVMQVEYMKRHVGDVFEGVIAGVTHFGIFVEITDLLVEGLVPLRDMLDDTYLFDEKHYALRGRRRGRTFQLGDHVKVRVTGLDPEDRTIDFALIEGGRRGD
jgi:ribonuclease R